MFFQPPPPIVVDVVKQPPPARDISVDTVLGIFALAGVFLLAGLVIALLGGGSFLLYRRMRDARTADDHAAPSGLGLSSSAPDPRLDAHSSRT